MILGIGVDVVEIERLRKILSGQGHRFLKRVFTPVEQEFCATYRDPAPHYAARFAAKEALFKALGTGWAKGVTWLDVEVRREKSLAPALFLKGQAEALAASRNCRVTHLSLTHSDHTAIAMVVLES